MKEIGNDKKGVQSGHVMNTLLIAMITHKHHKHFEGLSYTMKSVYSDEPPLICLYDLYLKDIADPSMQDKMAKNIKFLATDEVMMTEKEVIKKSINYKVNQYITRYLNSMYTKDRYYLQEIEDIHRARSHQELYQLRRSMKTKKTYQVDKAMDDHSRYISFFRHTQLDINRSLIIKITNPFLLDMIKQPVLLNSFKTKAEVEGFFNFIDWRQVQNKSERFEKQIQKVEYTNKFQKLINRNVQGLQRYYSEVQRKAYQPQALHPAMMLQIEIS